MLNQGINTSQDLIWTCIYALLFSNFLWGPTSLMISTEELFSKFYLPSIVFCWPNLFLWGKLFCKSIFPLNNLMVQVFRYINPLVIVFIHFSPCNFCWVKSWNCKVKKPWHKEQLSARVPGGVSFSVQLPHSTSTADNIWDKNMLLVNVPQPIIHKSIYLCAHTELK